MITNTLSNTKLCMQIWIQSTVVISTFPGDRLFDNNEVYNHLFSV